MNVMVGKENGKTKKNVRVVGKLRPDVAALAQTLSINNSEQTSIQI